MRSKPVFAIIGMIVVLIILVVVVYFAWIGWNEEGRPVPDVDAETKADR